MSKIPPHLLDTVAGSSKSGLQVINHGRFSFGFFSRKIGQQNTLNAGDFKRLDTQEPCFPVDGGVNPKDPKRVPTGSTNDKKRTGTTQRKEAQQ
jgi:hypothetical protein